MNRISDNKAIVIIILALASSLAPLSVDLLAPSLPQLSQALATSPQQIALSIYSFLIGYGLAPAIWGYLSDIKGRRPTLLTGMLLYCLSSLYCIAVDKIETLLLIRFIQGIGAAAGATIARAIIRDKFSAEGTAKAMSAMLSTMSLIPISAPIVGGILSHHYSWSAGFIVMTVISAIIIIAFYFIIGETRPHTSGNPAIDSISIHKIIRNRFFFQHALSNMFCVATMVLFVTNISQLMYSYYDFNTEQRGYVLTLFNAAIAAGTYCVWLLAPRIGIHRSILLGGTANTLGWACIVLLSTNALPPLVLLVSAMIISGLGCGIVISLSAGQALTPFSSSSGSASSLYIIMQTLGASAVSYGIDILAPKHIMSFALSMMICALLSIAIKILITEKAD